MQFVINQREKPCFGARVFKQSKIPLLKFATKKKKEKKKRRKKKTNKQKNLNE